MLQPGDIAPPFCLPDADMERIRLEQYRGHRYLVVYFYPKDDTPGCTIEAVELSDLQSQFVELDTEILGISRDTCASHGSFRDKYGLEIRLLADTEGEVCEAYGVWREKEAHGEKRMGILRSTFIIDKDGVVRHALYDVKPRGHAAQVLGLVHDMRDG